MIRVTLLSLIFSLAIASAQPRIFYSDLESEPNQGGEGGRGAYVTVYGQGFGAERGSSTVTVGGGRVAAYPIWTDTKIAFQLWSAAVTGDIVINASGSGASNGMPFTVRPGTIYFAGPRGSDEASGKFEAPWKTLLKARQAMKPGDIVYALDGLAQTTDDGESWNTCFLLRVGGTPGKPIAVVVYPGATATMGNVKGPGRAFRSMEQSPGHWVFAGFVMRGDDATVALCGSTDWRFAANDMSCPNGDSASACFESGLTTHVKLPGNTVHDAGKVSASALYHGVYFSTDSNHIEIGWNSIYNIRGCRGIHLHSSPLQGGGPKNPTGRNQFDLSVHDNEIHGTQCDGIIFATVAPSKGKVEVYNNIIYNAGKGPATPENSGNWSCIYVDGYTNTGPPGSGVVDIYNNTFANCGTFTTPPYRDAQNAVQFGGSNTAMSVQIRNNIFLHYSTTYNGKGTCTPGDPCKGIFGSNNLFSGNGPVLSNNVLVSSIHRDPNFVNTAVNDYRLQSTSPARGAGIATGLQVDKNEVERRQGAGSDLGAYQYTPPSTAQSTRKVQ